MTQPGSEEGAVRTWRLIGGDGCLYDSSQPGALGGHRRSRIYGRLDCPSAQRAITRGGYVTRRVFFANEVDAVAAGYRACAICMPDAYAAWRANSPKAGARRSSSFEFAVSHESDFPAVIDMRWTGFRGDWVSWAGWSFCCWFSRCCEGVCLSPYLGEAS